MSVTATGWAIQQGAKHELHPIEVLVLVILADFQNKTTGLCCPGQEAIAKLARCDIRSVRRAIVTLMAKGLITMARTGRMALYQLNRDAVANEKDPGPGPNTGHSVRNRKRNTGHSVRNQAPDTGHSVRNQAPTPDTMSGIEGVDTGLCVHEHRTPCPPNLTSQPVEISAPRSPAERGVCADADLHDVEGGMGSRANGTNPRALGTNPRARSENPRAVGTNPRTVEGRVVPMRPLRNPFAQMARERELADREAERTIDGTVAEEGEQFGAFLGGLRRLADG